MLIRLLLAGLLISASAAGCAQEPSQEPAEKQAVVQDPREPPNRVEVTELTTPLEILDAKEFWDGGTTYVSLRDAEGRTLLFCVSQWASEATIPANTLFINAAHPDAPTARLPISEREAQLVVGSLRAAVLSALPRDELDSLANMGDPAENKMSEQYTIPPEKRWSAKKWKAVYAFDALRRLEARKSIDVVSAGGGPMPSWHVAYVAEQAKKLAEREQERRADELFESFYPENARICFHSKTTDSDVVVAKPESLEGHDDAADKPDDPELIQGRRLAQMVGNPVTLAVDSCQALGTLRGAWSVTDHKERVALFAAKTVGADDFLVALAKLTATNLLYLAPHDCFSPKALAPRWLKNLAPNGPCD